MRTDHAEALNTSPTASNVECYLEPSANYDLLALHEERDGPAYRHYTLERVRYGATHRYEIYLKSTYIDPDTGPQCRTTVRFPLDSEQFQKATIAMREAGESDEDYVETIKAWNSYVLVNTRYSIVPVTEISQAYVQDGEFVTKDPIVLTNEQGHLSTMAQILEALDDERRKL